MYIIYTTGIYGRMISFSEIHALLMIVFSHYNIYFYMKIHDKAKIQKNSNAQHNEKRI